MENGYKGLIVWKKSIELVREIYGLVRLLPKEETYALSDQMRRAAVSIPSNIAEGYARKTTKEYLNFLSIAQGSNAELETQIILCEELEFIKKERLDRARELVTEIRRMLLKIQQKLSPQS